mmetsp:Transcript_17293/g.41313  ORF Transcript_17293/g.41313 Transcript_17293/m.41313 type:complete len:629 (+) Transcript_17293:163-2049(+)
MAAEVSASVELPPEGTVGEDNLVETTTEAVEEAEVSENQKVEVKPIYVVRLPRPDVDETSQRVLADELEVHKAKVRLLNEHFNLKKKEKDTAQANRQEAYEQLKIVQKERQALVEELQPLRSARKNVQADLSAFRDERRELVVQSEQELDAKIAELEYRRSHETLTLNEEKQILKDMKKLEGHRERVRELEAQSVSVPSTEAEKAKLNSSIKHLESQLEMVRLEEDTQWEIFQKYRSQEQKIEEQIKSIKEERSEVSAVKDGLFDKLRALERQTRGKLTEFHDVRRLVKKVQEQMAEGQWEAAQQLALAHNEGLHARMASDKGFYDEYCRLLSKNRRLPMIPSMDDDSDEEESSGKAHGGKGKGRRSAAAQKQEMPQDIEARAKAKAKDLIDKLLSQADEELRSSKAPPAPPVPEPELPAPAAEPAKLHKPAAKPKPRVAHEHAPPPEAAISIDDGFVPPKVREEREEKTEAELKEELRRKNAEAAKQAAAKKERRKKAAERRRHKAEEARQRAEQARAEKEAAVAAAKEHAPADPGHSSPAVSADEPADAEPQVKHVPEQGGAPARPPPKTVPSVPAAALPPKLRPPRKSQKSMTATLTRYFKDNQKATAGIIVAAAMATAVHYFLR